MLKNYFKIAFRNLYKNKAFSLINILGLAVGMACCILIMLWVQDELSYDRFNQNADQLHFVILNQSYSDGQTVITTSNPAPLGPALKEEIPEIVNSTRYSPYIERLLIRYGDESHIESVRAVDNAILQMFTFPLLKGDPATALTEPSSIVLTEEMAEKYFGDEDLMGKTLTVRGEHDFKITGILKNIPENSTIRPNFLVPFDFVEKLDYELDNWGLNTFWTLVQLPAGMDYHSVEEKIVGFLQEHHETTSELSLHPLTRFHLYSIRGDGGGIKYVRLFSLIAVFILLIACINFMNLSTARSEQRAREVGMRKVVGANRVQLVRQFMGESIITAFFALFIAVIMVELLLPVFNTLAEKELGLSLTGNAAHLLGILATAIVTGLLAGSYPALFLSRFKPVKVLKGATSKGPKSSWFRKGLVILQFTLSVTLIICTTIVYSQLTYMKNKDMGIRADNVIRLPIEGLRDERYRSFKTELLQSPDVESVTASCHWPMYVGSNTTGWDWDGRDPENDILMDFTLVDFDFEKTFKLQLVEGRFFSQEFATDSNAAIVVNEAAVKHIGMEDPVGKRLSVFDQDNIIIGVVKDYHTNSLHREIQPMGMFIMPSWHDHIFVRLNGEAVSSGLDYVESVYERMNPGYPFNATFLDEIYDGMYEDEQRMGSLFKYFSMLAIFVSCLGLFGLASYAIERRTKEIGIRKVLGATVTNIISLVSKEFLLLVALACVVAGPVAWYFMNQWLHNFAYRINIGAWIFIAAAGLALVIAMLTVSFQSIRAAMANPIMSLRYE